MASGQDRQTILDRLREKIAAGRPILCAGAGHAAAAMNLQKAGSDLMFTTCGLRLGRTNDLVFGLLPYANANKTVIEIGRDVLGAVRHTPMIAGVCASDPGYGHAHFLKQLQKLGFAGVQNDPSLGLLDGEYRKHLETSGMCYSQEVECISVAHQLDLLSVGNVFCTDEARAMMKAGADIILTHLDLFPDSNELKVGHIQEIAAVCRAFRHDVILLVRIAPGTSLNTLRIVLESCPTLSGFQFHLPLADFPDELAFVRQLLNYKKLSLVAGAA